MVCQASVGGIGVITNPKSRANRREPARMRELADLLGSQGAAVTTHNLDDLRRTAEIFKATGIDILGINGGDGTISVTLTTFVEVYGAVPLPNIAILRGGTMNTVARGLGIQGTPHELLLDITSRYLLGEPLAVVERPILRVGDRCGFIFGNGAIANFLEAYYATGRPSPLTGATTLIHAVGSSLVRGPFARELFRRFRGRVTVDGTTWPVDDFLTLTAATVPEVGLGFRPFTRCLERAGHFELLGIHCSPLALVQELPDVYLGRPLRTGKCIGALARAALIESDDEFSYTIDGDLHRTSGTLRLAAGPTLRLIVP